jgi:hypothetical protein
MQFKNFEEKRSSKMQQGQKLDFPVAGESFLIGNN